MTDPRLTRRDDNKATQRALLKMLVLLRVVAIFISLLSPISCGDPDVKLIEATPAAIAWDDPNDND